MSSFTESDAETKIKQIIPIEIKAPIIEVIKRESISRLEHNAVFAIIFKHTKENALLMIEAVKKLSTQEPKIVFSGSEIDEKFDMQNNAVFITATVK